MRRTGEPGDNPLETARQLSRRQRSAIGRAVTGALREALTPAVAKGGTGRRARPPDEWSRFKERALRLIRRLWNRD